MTLPSAPRGLLGDRLLTAAFGRLKPILKRTLPVPLRGWLGTVLGRLPPGSTSAWVPSSSGQNIYEALYEAHGKMRSDEEVVGGLFEYVGRVELGLLLMEGLQPTDTVVDFGCGTGRLAVQLIPVLHGGHYIGVDVSQSMLVKAQRRVGTTVSAPPCRISWIKQTTPVFPFEDRSVDLVCAFSVFTHIEHEDTYRYLKDARRVIRPGGRFIFSCLPMTLTIAREFFLASAQEDFQRRWSQVRNVTTSVDLMEEIAGLAGWAPLRWYAGDQPNIRLPDTGALAVLGQSSCVLLEAPPSTPGATLAADEVGRIVLTWTDDAVTLAPHFTGPLPEGSGRFHLSPSSDPGSRGSLTAPPFAALSFDPGQRTATIAVSRLSVGVYRYSVAAQSGSGRAGDPLARSGATVHVLYHETPRPMVFRISTGAGLRWTVFDVVVDGDGVALHPLNTREGDADESRAEAWSPPV